MGTRVDADIFPLVVPLVFDGRSSTRGCGVERGVATHLERLRLEGLLERIFVRASKLAHALALEELHRGRAAWSRGERTSWLASVWLSKPTVCEKRSAPVLRARYEIDPDLETARPRVKAKYVNVI